MSDSKLEVFILSYNRPKYLERCLYSFLQQTYDSFDLIVLDNKSDFNVEELVSKFESSKIRLIINDTNIGSFGNFTKAIKLSSKKFVMIFHDDDCISPNLIETQISLFDQYTQTGFIVTGVNLVSDFSKIADFIDSKIIKFHYYPNKGDILDVYYSGKSLGFGSIMYKTELVKKIQPEPEKYAQVIDRAYMLNLSSHSSFIILDSPNYNALQHDKQDSFTRSWDFKYDINLLNLYLDTCNTFKKHNIKWKVCVSCAELYSLRRPFPSLKKTINSIQFNSKLYLVIFLLFLPYFIIRTRLLFIIKLRTPFIYKYLTRIKKIIK